MKALRSHVRGGPETLVYEDSPEPPIAAGEALIRVHAAAITPTELTWNSTWTDSNGKDRRPIVPSFEVSGVVERVGDRAADVRRADPVYGLLNFWRDGAAAEFVTSPDVTSFDISEFTRADEMARIGESTTIANLHKMLNKLDPQLFASS